MCGTCSNNVVCSLFTSTTLAHLCMDNPKRPTPVRRRLSLARAVLNKLIPIDLVLTLKMQAESTDILLEYSVSHVKFVH